ncbi:MAG: serine/threonine protein kinase, partial [Blastocatellia bacterium]|nr:serine/threonine protein kinase [Blastocatellia bacterium]
MEPALQARIIARALELGILHQNDLDQAEVHLRQDTGVFPPSHWGRHLDILIRLGRIRAEEVENLHEELVSEIETSAGLVSNGNHALLETSNPELPLVNPAPKTAPTSPRITVQEGFPVKNWDRYEFRKLLGRGGMGLVYQAWDPQLNRLVALKFLRTNNEQMTHRFLQEARSQSRIEHQNICKVYEAGEVEGLPYIAMQFIDGQSLRRVQKNLTLEQKVRLMRDIAQAIHAAHRLGIIHRDLKPDNILVVESEDGNFRPVVMDFGLAKEVGTEGLTETGVVMGTPAYMSPEQARGEVRLLDRRSDVYSLGVVFYEMLTGKLPFTDENAMKVVLKIINDEPLSVASRLNTIPLDLNIITMKCLEKDPSHRYDSAQALALDLQHYLDGDPISTRAQTWPSKLLKKARKHRALVTVSSVALALVLLTGAFSLWSWWQLSKQAELTRQMGE